MHGFEHSLAQMEAAERGDGWTAACLDAQVYLALNREFVSALAEAFAGREALEIGAADGALAAALAGHGVRMIATDPNPRGDNVLSLDAREALVRFSPCSVLACFPPVDAAIEAEVLATASVSRFVTIGPEWNGRVGADILWNQSGWSVTPLPEVDRYLVSRLDYLLDFTRATRQRRAGALCLERI